ncbi:MAG: RNA polymerase sigma factor [Limisphaerales bacterium]
MQATDDLALAALVTAGDEDALAALYDRYADPLFGFIYHALDHARPDAEEVWQDTLSAAIRALPTYRGQGQLFSWLCGIARHKLADHCRRRNRPGQDLFLVPPEDLTRLLDQGPLPEEVLSQKATCLRIVEVLGQLPPDYRAALSARYADGSSVEEVARLLAKSYKATESLLSRARAAFRAALSGQTEIQL